MATRDRSAGPTAETDDEGFLGRWSRRKAAVKAEDAGPEAALVDPDTPSDLVAEDGLEETSPPAIDPATLPDIDSLGAGSDFSVFMQAGVPPALKTKALRKLWRVKPELANLDGLLDYGEDLTGSFKVVDHLKTAYEVGKGFLRAEDEKEPGTDAAGQDDVVAEAPLDATADDGPAAPEPAPTSDQETKG